MAFIVIGIYGVMLIGVYVLVRGIELAIAWRQYQERIRDARRRNAASLRRFTRP